MLYGSFVFDSLGLEKTYVYSESLQEAEDYVNRTFSSLSKGEVIGIWEMDEFGVFDLSQGAAIVYKKK